MQPTSRADRERELAGLLDQIKAHPERAWTEERRRIATLQATLAAQERAA